MKAIVQNTYGSPDVLRLAEVEAPRIGDHELLVAVHASVVTQGDRRLRAGDFPALSWLPGRLFIGLTGPRKPVTGTTFSGRVTAVGKAITRFSVGDDVFGTAMRGAYAEQLAVGETGAIGKMPAGLSYEEAAALPYGAVTALRFLRDLGALQPGQRVCILGASGGVGLYAAQIAKAMGAEVTAVCSQPKQALVRSLGATHVIDYRTEDFRRTGQRFDIIFDTLGTSSFKLCRDALTPTGRYLSLITGVRLLLQMLVTRILGGKRAMTGIAMGTPQDLETVAALVEQGALRPVIDRSYPLDQVAEAHRRVESGQAQGTVVVQVAAPRPSLAVSA